MGENNVEAGGEGGENTRGQDCEKKQKDREAQEGAI